MKPYKFLSALLFGTVLFASCKPGSTKSSDVKYEEKRLGDSKYMISLNNRYKINEKPGPDFTVFNFAPIDQSATFVGTAGVYFGNHPQKIKPSESYHLIKDSIIKSNFLGNSVDWIIYQYDKHISAETIVALNEFEKANAFASSTTYPELDSLLKMLGTVKAEK